MASNQANTPNAPPREGSVRAKRENTAILLPLFFLSGFCNLVYEIVWARMFNLVFGVTVFAVSAVLASFMLGLAVGGMYFGRVVEKSKKPARLFSFLHGGILLSTLALLLLFPVFQGFFVFISHRLNSDFYLLRVFLFFLSALLMIIPTALMGGTFPVANVVLADKKEKIGRVVGSLYSVNTLGSVAGCVAAIFFLLGSVGMRGSIVCAASIDLLICLVALTMKKQSSNPVNSL
jgi:spermidine synthase